MHSNEMSLRICFSEKFKYHQLLVKSVKDSWSSMGFPITTVMSTLFLFSIAFVIFFCLDGSLRTGFIYSLFNFNSCTCCGFCIKNEKHYKNLAALRIYQTNNIFFLFLFSCLFFLLYFFQPCMGGLECVCVNFDFVESKTIRWNVENVSTNQ